MKSTITKVLLFHKRSVFSYPFTVVQISNPYNVEFLLMLCVCYLFRSQSYNPNIFLAKQTEFGRIFSSTTYLIHFFLFSFACECLPGILTVYVVCGSVVCTIKAYLCCFTQFTVDQSKLTVNGSALPDTPNVRYLVALYVCDGKHRPERFLFFHKTKFHNNKFTASQHPLLPNVVPCLGYINVVQGSKHNIDSASTHPLNQSLKFTAYLKETDNQSNII